jgi:hypothetical protein
MTIAIDVTTVCPRLTEAQMGRFLEAAVACRQLKTEAERAALMLGVLDAITRGADSDAPEER